MRIPDFELERWKAKFVVPGVVDLTETGIPEPLRLRDIFSEAALDLRLDYAPIYGDEVLREEVSRLYSNVEKENVLVTSSTSEANIIGVNTVVNGGDEVLILQPSFMQIPGLLEANGVRIREYSLREENGFEFDVGEFNECVTAKTRVIALNFPNNPTGRVLDGATVKAICEIAKDRGAWIVCDEVYRGIEFAGPFSPSFAEYYDRAVVSSSLSKVWGLPGLRVGWMVGPREVVERGSAFKEYTTLGGSALSEYLARIVLEKETCDRLVERGRRLVRESFDVFNAWMESHEDTLSWFKPGFGVISLVKHRLNMSSSRFADMLLAEKKIAVVPCDVCFPKLDDSSHYLRISYCHPPGVLKRVLSEVDDLIEHRVGVPAAG